MCVAALPVAPLNVAVKVTSAPPAASAAASGVQAKTPPLENDAPEGSGAADRVGVPEGCVAVTVKLSCCPSVAETRPGALTTGGGGLLTVMTLPVLVVVLPSPAVKVTG